MTLSNNNLQYIPGSSYPQVKPEICFSTVETIRIRKPLGTRMGKENFPLYRREEKRRLYVQIKYMIPLRHILWKAGS